MKKTLLTLSALLFAGMSVFGQQGAVITVNESDLPPDLLAKIKSEHYNSRTLYHGNDRMESYGR